VRRRARDQSLTGLESERTPGHYIPAADVTMHYIVQGEATSFRVFEGRAGFPDVRFGAGRSG
jgi:uncharacterized protein (DUF427 family)